MFTKKEIVIIVLFLLLFAALLFLLFYMPPRYQLIIQPRAEDICSEDLIQADDPATLAAYASEVDRVPLAILQSFSGNQWLLAVDPDYLAKQGERTGVEWGGATSYRDGKIYVCSTSAVLHEFGHYLDCALMFPQKHSDLFLSEAQSAISLLGHYSTTCTSEYFAAYFSYWIRNENDPAAMSSLKDLSPDTYEYFEYLSENNWGLNTNRIFLRARPDDELVERYANRA